MALYLLYGIVSITRRFKLNELLVILRKPLPLIAIANEIYVELFLVQRIISPLIKALLLLPG